MRTQKEPKRARTLIKAVPLIIVLVVVAIITNRISKEGLPSHFASLLESPMEDYTVVDNFTEQEKDSARKMFAGFWEKRQEYPGGAFVEKDRLELKDNGIIWQVKEYTLQLPSNREFVVSHVIHGALVPYGYSKNDTGAVVCDVLIIRQNVVAENDTCYGESNAADLWKMKKTEKSLRINDADYLPYGTASLDTFFQQGILNTIDDFTVEACLHGVNKYALLLDTLIADMAQMKVKDFSRQKAKEMIGRYYAHVLGGIISSYGMPESSVPDSIEIGLSITASGKVINPRIIRADIKRELFEKSLVEDIRAWRFPRREERADTIDVSFMFVP
ncbi:MAG: hypothetical protein GF401_20075 [Chitinivibrionales bacterium]|nr:hypothetical protein [Chitinivibrionales bacterium]